MELQRNTLRAEDVGLITVNTDGPGWTRQPWGSGFCYRTSNGDVLDGTARARCVRLAIPPAWEDVWICPEPMGNIQAYGSDPAGRRQYIYHERWREAADLAKYNDLVVFAERLPRLRRRVTQLLAAEEDTPETVAAIVVRLLDRAGLRIGSRRAHRTAGTVGATTLRAEHVTFEGEAGLTLDFRAKGGKERTLVLTDATLINAIRALMTESDDGRIFHHESHRIEAGFVNDFIATGMDAGFSAKDFRTWGGSVAAAKALWQNDPPTITSITEAAAAWLGNTQTVARNAYVHPAIIDRVGDDRPLPDPSGPTRLRLNERRTYAVISND